MKQEASRERSISLDINKITAYAIVIIAIAFALISVILVVRSFMRVSEIEVTGYSSYSSEDIISASGIKMGDKLYSVDKAEVVKNIMRECSYVSSVNVKFRFPNTVSIDLECYTAVWYVEIEGDFYSLDADLRVLEETVNEKKYINGKITKLTLPNISSAVVGSELTFGLNDKEREFSYDFMEKLKRMSFKSRLSLVDIDNRFDINIGVDGTIDVYLGDGAEMEDKLKAVEKALASEKLVGCISAEIYAADPKAIYIKPVYDYGAVNGEENAENE